MTSRRDLPIVFVLAACLACTGGSSPSSPLPRSVPIDRNPRLTFAAGCDPLESAIEDAVVLQMKSEIEQIRKGWGRMYATGSGGSGGVAVPAADTAAPGPGSYTTTNTQVSGVDEADFVQNDGTRIAVLADGRLHLLSSWPAKDLAETASLAIEGWHRELFLAGNQVVVFSDVYVPRALEGGALACGGGGGGGTVGVAAMAMPDAIWCGYGWGNATKITTVDVSAPSAPAIVSEIFLPGGYLSARRIGERVRVVTTDSLPYPEGVNLWPQIGQDGSESTRDRAFDDLEARNESLIRARTLDDWLRRGSVERPDGTIEDLGYACGDFALGSMPSRPGILTIATLDLGAGTLASRTSVIAQADVVYASASTLYATARHWWWWPEPGQEDATYVHAFDLRGPDRAAYLGSGVVDGTVDDQYHLDEYEGALRVASTLTSRVDGADWWGTVQLSNQVAVLGLSDGALRTLGKTEPFGGGERMFATRFLGTRGFVVTARQIDPLFTFDLADPAHPTKVGELEMPGFVAYLHPLDDTHLLGVGREPGASGTMQVKVQLYDVSDLATPRASPPVLVGEGWSYSDALWDPKAFTWFAAKGLLAIPFADYGSYTFVSDLRLFRVDPVAGITPAGRLSMADVFTTQSGPGWSYSWSPYVRRGILAEDLAGGTFVYAISDAGVRSADLSKLSDPLATVLFAPLSGP